MTAQITPLATQEKDQVQENEQFLTDPIAPLLYGYIRNTNKEQSLDDQYQALRRAGVSEDCIFTEQSTSRDALEYANLLRTLRPGDSLVVSSLDKLGVTYDELIAQWQLLTRIKQIDIIVLDIPLLDTRKQQSSLSSSFIADLALQFMAYAATREREGIRQRQREGILAAKERGVRFGRPPKPIPPQFETLLAQWKNREISSRKAAQQLGVAQETFLRWSRKHT